MGVFVEEMGQRATLSTKPGVFVDKVREGSVQGNVILPGWQGYQKLKYSRRWST